ncbi:MAG: membrane protein insertase YidC [Tannerella sp.]|jgi:YidC/Oxa1 family membrane protein insertase|nr:membrane protein insertase YidC [Tannerella sp.]
MDKNTITGFILIGLLIIGFSWWNRPSKEQIAAQQRSQDSIAVIQQRQQQMQQEELTNKKEEQIFSADSISALPDSLKQQQLTNNFGAFASASTGTEEVVTLENSKIEVKINTKGGHIEYVRLKDFVTYEKEPLILFDGEDSKFDITLVTATNRVINTSELYFTKETGTSPNSVTMRLSVGDKGIIDFIYTLNQDDYMLDFEIKTSGLNGILAPSTNSLDIRWTQNMRTLEKGRKLENQYTGLYYKFLADDVEHFGEAKDEEKQISNRVKWIGYKNKFFASVLIADNSFSATSLYAKQNPASNEYLKEFGATTAVAFNLTGNETLGFHYYFGPNKYHLLKDYDKGLEVDKELNLDELVPLGYSWLRPINKYFILPIFDFLGKFITNYGLIIFLLTLIVKTVLFPFTYKSYMSQAKMRVLKPQVDELKKKFPKKEQAVELQQATMSLYSKAGASPLSGCLPMILPLPILIALYWLFPTSIELRQQSFLWAEDLSTYDAFISWKQNIPLITGFIGNHISLFCLLMTIVNVIYSKVNMAMTNTGQQQMPGMNMMMYMMPVMFFFFFNQSSSGLSYYFLISTLISIGQTMIFRFSVNEAKLLVKLEENKKKPKKKSGFMKRLEEVQRAQQEQTRKRQQALEKQQRSGKR